MISKHGRWYKASAPKKRFERHFRRFQKAKKNKREMTLRLVNLKKKQQSDLKVYGVNETRKIVVFVLYCIVLYCILLYCIVLYCKKIRRCVSCGTTKLHGTKKQNVLCTY